MQVARQIPQIIGTNIARRRAELKLSRRGLAVELGTDQTLIFKWERGQHRPSDHYLAELSRVMGRDVGWFYTDHEQAAA